MADFDFAEKVALTFSPLTLPFFYFVVAHTLTQFRDSYNLPVQSSSAGEMPGLSCSGLGSELRKLL
jgi:hypothetical protein